MPKVVVNKLISLAILIATFAFGYVSLSMGATMQWAALAAIFCAAMFLFKNC
jgi:uncharacterized membrane protein required for colicin V production